MRLDVEAPVVRVWRHHAHRFLVRVRVRIRIRVRVRVRVRYSRRVIVNQVS